MHNKMGITKLMSKFLFNLIVLVLLATLVQVECKSLSNKVKAQKDPLLAVPTDDQTQVVYEHQEQPSSYMVPNEQALQQDQPLEADQKQEVYYVVDSESGNHQQRSVVGGEQADTNEKPCDTRTQLDGRQQVESARGDYPAEILYVGGQQQGVIAGPTSERAADYVEAIGQSSGLPATILSEVPVRDIPPHVLEKLKRQYGVRVVATRERPGANLVINCDDYNGHSGTICAGKSLQPSTLVNMMPETYLENSQNPSVGDAGQDQDQDQVQGYRLVGSELTADKPENESHDFGTRTQEASSEQVVAGQGGEEHGELVHYAEQPATVGEQQTADEPSTEVANNDNYTQQE